MSKGAEAEIREFPELMDEALAARFLRLSRAHYNRPPRPGKRETVCLIGAVGGLWHLGRGA